VKFIDNASGMTVKNVTVEERASMMQQTDTADNFYKNHNKALVILRGIAYAPQYVHYSGKRVDVDFRTAAQSIRAHIIQDLAQRSGYGAVDVHLVTYPDIPDDVRRDLVRIYAPAHIHFMDVPSTKGTQRAVFKRCLRVITENATPDVDVAVIARFDTEIKTPLTSLRIDPTCVNFLWREMHARKGSAGDLLHDAEACRDRETQESLASAAAEEEEQRTRRVRPEDVRVTSDVLHVLPPTYAPAFLEAVEASKPSNNLHGVYAMLLQVLARNGMEEDGDSKLPVSFMFDEAYESNTDIRPNPVYHIVREGASRMLGGPTPVFWKKLLGRNWKAL